MRKRPSLISSGCLATYIAIYVTADILDIVATVIFVLSERDIDVARPDNCKPSESELTNNKCAYQISCLHDLRRELGRNVRKLDDTH